VTKVYICGDGFIGKQLLEDFTNDSGYQVSQQFPELKRSHLIANDDIQLLAQKLRNQRNHIFINASGQSSVQDSFDNYLDSVQTPAQQVLRHIELLSLAQRPIIYVFLSSAAVYGETSPLGISENGSLRPMSPYAEGKIGAEEVLSLFGRDNTSMISVLILRVFSAYSEKLASRVLHKIVEASRQGNHFKLAGNGSESRDFIHSSEIYRVIAFLTNTKLQKIDIFNVGSGTGIEIQKLMKIADEVYANLHKKHLKYSFDGSKRFGDPINLVANIDKLLNAGFKPQIKPREGLKKFFVERFSK
jgi:nucleoside-diphosphate-sugar epimerase